MPTIYVTITWRPLIQIQTAFISPQKGKHSSIFFEIERQVYVAILLLQLPLLRPQPDFPSCLELNGIPWKRELCILTILAAIVGAGTKYRFLGNW